MSKTSKEQTHVKVNMKFSDIFLDAGTGKMSQTKLWQNIGNTIGTFIILYLTWTNGITIDYFIAYMAILTMHATASKFLSIRFGIPDKDDKINKYLDRRTLNDDLPPLTTPRFRR